MPQHLQFVLGYGPLATGVRLLPLAAGVSACALVTTRLTAKPVVLADMALGTVAVFLLTRVSATASGPRRPWACGCCAAPAK